METAQKEALQYLVDLGMGFPQVVDVHSREGIQTKLVIPGNGGTPELLEFESARRERRHEFHTLQSFKDYLNSEDCGSDHGVIFVNPESVYADLAYKEHTIQAAKLPLTFSDEFIALQDICGKYHGQKELWRKLISDLHGCIDAGLLLSISQIRIAASREDEAKVDITGVGSSQSKEAFAITYADPRTQADKTAEIPVEWNWKGPIYDCFPEESAVCLRLEVATTDRGLAFIFHPRKLRQVMQSAREAIVQSIASEVPDRFRVYEGTYAFR
jgi:hypothetical protein